MGKIFAIVVSSTVTIGLATLIAYAAGYDNGLNEGKAEGIKIAHDSLQHRLAELAINLHNTDNN